MMGVLIIVLVARIFTVNGAFQVAQETFFDYSV